ncbi:outer membrane protein [Sulfurovum sp.]|uniref:outer membrane protein n=1 Tax=Sulfurovum sp. TaxID=1969726 RepID=UPI003562B554
MKKIMISALVASNLALAGGDIAPVEPVIETPVVEANPWKNEVSIYAWLPTISANTPLPDSGDSIDAEDILDNLKMVFMGGYSGRNDTWSMFADVIYMDIGDSKNHTFTNGDNAHVSVDMKALLMHAGVGYNLVDTGDSILDVVGGVRYVDLETGVSTAGRILEPDSDISASKDFTDFFVGVKGYKNINENWYIPYEADIGSGDTELSWQVFAGIGYRYDWGDVKLGYRYLEFDMEDDAVVDDLTLSGAVLGVSIKF